MAACSSDEKKEAYTDGPIFSFRPRADSRACKTDATPEPLSIAPGDPSDRSMSLAAPVMDGSGIVS